MPRVCLRRGKILVRHAFLLPMECLECVECVECQNNRVFIKTIELLFKIFGKGVGHLFWVWSKVKGQKKIKKIIFANSFKNPIKKIPKFFQRSKVKKKIKKFIFPNSFKNPIKNFPKIFQRSKVKKKLKNYFSLIRAKIE